MEKSGSGGGVSFPLYDGHGNMIATLSRSGSGSYAVSNARSYDVWGSVRSGASSGYPNTRYCANLGHKQDDESGLLYMRARYYEPWTGRFVTEDPSGEEPNLFAYCENLPTQAVDPEGLSTTSEFFAMMADFWKVVGMSLMLGAAREHLWTEIRIAASVLYKRWKIAGSFAFKKDMASQLIRFLHALKSGHSGLNARLRQTGVSVATMVAGYQLVLWGFLLDAMAEEIDPYSPNEGLLPRF